MRVHSDNLRPSLLPTRPVADILQLKRSEAQGIRFNAGRSFALLENRLDYATGPIFLRPGYLSKLKALRNLGLGHERPPLR